MVCRHAVSPLAFADVRELSPVRFQRHFVPRTAPDWLESHAGSALFCAASRAVLGLAVVQEPSAD